MRGVTFVVAAIALFLGAGEAGWAQRQDTIGFGGFDAGKVVKGVQACGGRVRVRGFNESFGPGVNAAVVFDTANPTGDDDDLGSPNETCPEGGPGEGNAGQVGRQFENCPEEPIGNVLIIAEDLTDADNDGLVDDPDDEGTGAADPQYTFDFSGVGGVTTVSIDLLDTEEPGPTVQLFDAENNLVGFFELPSTGNNGFAEAESLGPTAGVDRLVLVLNGSGSIDDLVVQCDALGDGCSRRFWKRNASAWQATSYMPDQSVESVFAAASAFGSGSKKLLRALGFNQRGSGAAGGAKILLRAAVASVLNASHPEVGFPSRERDLIRAVNEALESGDRDGMIALADELAANNSLGCPLD